MTGFYELVCEYCNRTIHQSWVYAWFADDVYPNQPYKVLHRSKCLELYKAENDDREILHKGAPYFKLYMEYMGDTVII